MTPTCNEDNGLSMALSKGDLKRGSKQGGQGNEARQGRQGKAMGQGKQVEQGGLSDRARNSRTETENEREGEKESETKRLGECLSSK